MRQHQQQKWASLQWKLAHLSHTKLKNDCDRLMAQKLTDQPLPNPKSKI
ncbi:hypothetical protein H6G79_26520 [Anabaena sp. FACHB-83]|nr:hypothetical protein [Anabaena sp. FACHB-83]